MVKPGKRTAIYARVSTNAQTTDTQTRSLERHCRDHQLQVVKTYIDHGISGAKESRPQLDQLMADAKNHQFDVVLVWKFDRFGRSANHLLNTLKAFKKLGIDFVSITDHMDTSTAAGKAMFGMLSVFAEFERDIISERIRAKLADLKAKGVQLGHPCGKVNPRFEALVRRLYKTLSLRDVAERVGVSHQTVYNIIKRSAA